MAQIIELLGRFPRTLALTGHYSHELFNRKGELRNIHKLRYWPLDQVLVEKYHHEEKDAKLEADFLVPLLHLAPDRRADAGGMSTQEWLQDTLFMEHALVDRPVGSYGDDILGWAYEVRDRRPEKSSR